MKVEDHRIIVMGVACLEMSKNFGASKGSMNYSNSVEAVALKDSIVAHGAWQLERDVCWFCLRHSFQHDQVFTLQRELYQSHTTAPRDNCFEEGWQEDWVAIQRTSNPWQAMSRVCQDVWNWRWARHCETISRLYQKQNKRPKQSHPVQWQPGNEAHAPCNGPGANACFARYIYIMNETNGRWRLRSAVFFFPPPTNVDYDTRAGREGHEAQTWDSLVRSRIPSILYSEALQGTSKFKMIEI